MRAGGSGGRRRVRGARSRARSPRWAAPRRGRGRRAARRARACGSRCPAGPRRRRRRRVRSRRRGGPLALALRRDAVPTASQQHGGTAPAQDDDQAGDDLEVLRAAHPSILYGSALLSGPGGPRHHLALIKEGRGIMTADACVIPLPSLISAKEGRGQRWVFVRRSRASRTTRSPRGSGSASPLADAAGPRRRRSHRRGRRAGRRGERPRARGPPCQHHRVVANAGGPLRPVAPRGSAAR